MALAEQNAKELDVSQLTPLTHEVMSRQATINFGTIGHVAHGKSTVVRAISGVQTIRFKNEKERNITIKLGYANAKIYKCTSADCPPPACYASFGSKKEDDPPCEQCGSPMKLLRHVSFVDCPGHDILMSTMLNASAVMDAALLLIAGNEPCPQPQTSEHVAAVEVMGLDHLIILQNKVELISKAQAQKHHEEIVQFVRATVAERAPIIPMSAVLRHNVDVLCEYIVTQIPVPIRDFTTKPHMVVIRSFDVNKPGEDAEKLRGGVAGGSILRGVIRVGDEIELRPGKITQQGKGCQPILTKILSLYAEDNALQYAVPGGLIGVGTQIDPSLSRGDRLVGQILGLPGMLPGIMKQMEIKFILLRRLLGIRSQTRERSDNTRVEELKVREVLMVNVGCTTVAGRVIKVYLSEQKEQKEKAREASGEKRKIANDLARIELFKPVCTSVGDKITLSRKVDKNFRLIGWGEIMSGRDIVPESAF